MLKDSAIFSLRKEGGEVAGLRWWMPKLVQTLAGNMLTSDEPDHTRLRSIVDEAFRRRAIVAMEPRIRAIADELAEKLFADGSPADLVARYAQILPLSVISELLGLPESDRPMFIGWANTMSRVNSAIGFLSVLPAFSKMRRYMDERLRAVRAHGGEGLIAELVQVEREGGRISHDEMLSMLFLLLNAGSITTTHLIGGAVFELLKDPARRDWLAADWSRAALAVEEFLRFVAPVQFSKPRYVREDVEIEGVHLRKGDAGDGDDRGGEYGRRGEPASREARSRAQAEPAFVIRHRNPFLSRPSACADRGDGGAGSAVHALAEARACRCAVASSLPAAARTAIDRQTAGAGGGPMIASNIASFIPQWSPLTASRKRAPRAIIPELRIGIGLA